MSCKRGPGIEGNPLFGENRQALIVDDGFTTGHHQAVAGSRKRWVDSDHIAFEIVRWSTIQMSRDIGDSVNTLAAEVSTVVGEVHKLLPSSLLNRFRI